jgi:hypothetical protein
MSKWLRRGFGHNTSDANQPDDRRPPDHTNEFPEPPRSTEMPAAAAYGTQQSAQAMVGYGAPAGIAMDVVEQNQRPKYAPHSQYQAPNASVSNKGYDPSGRGGRNAREDPEEGGHRSRSSRSSSRGPSGRQRYGSQSSQSRGSTNAPPSMTPTSQHFTPPPGTFGQRPPTMSGTPPPSDSLQPTYPPPAVTSESPPPQEQAQRRPAYLLHRDLVIGKGSYGQVCIASRGESEGHSNGRSGKRKKFACKCVMLRNDPKYIAKLQEEVNVLREVRGHDNVIRLYDVFCVDNELFIITELGRGGDLFHLLTTHPKHGVTEAYAGKYIENDH